ncbi:uncharacterized protein LOC135844387 isoform X3 [Planococcus citri]|uniref:uncharacterized protein LOC135844387 isoform X3 n=1 Tax=Planococcus citri TaxID=170843 RepID=UPI0031F9D7AE
MDSSNDTSDQVASKPTPEEVDTPKEDNTISDPLSMGNSKDDSAQSTPKPCSETEVNTETNAVGAVDDATCKHPRDDEQCSPASKRSKSSDEVKPGPSDAVTSPSTRSRVVVFDIENTLCYTWFLTKEQEAIIRRSFPECPVIVTKRITTERPHAFLPHLKSLFGYLLEQGVRIIFFYSDTDKNRGAEAVTALQELLTLFWGSEIFAELKAEGQFDIFTEEHLLKGTSRDEGNDLKDLKDLRLVIRGSETLLDAILVEDDRNYALDDQKPCLYIIDLTRWLITDKDKIGKNKERESFWGKKSDNFPLNSVYYMLGVFKTYFENEKYKKLPLREALDILLPKEAKAKSVDFFKTHSFVDCMINLGLSEVRKVVPSAMYY